MVDRAQVEDWVRAANVELAPIGVQYRVKRLRTLSNPYRRYDSKLSLRDEKWLKLRILTYRRGWYRPRRWITSWIVPGAETYSYGFASGVCPSRYPMTLSTGQLKNSRGEDRVYQGEVAFEHETGHVIGAWHKDYMPASIMHPDALSYSSEKLHFNFESFAEINECVRDGDLRNLPWWMLENKYETQN